jgi:putative transposase
MFQKSNEPTILRTRKTIRHFNTPGHAHFLTFSCFHRRALLKSDLWCTWLAEAIRNACNKHRFALWAYVFMPEHVHLLVRPRNEVYDISLFLKAIKKPVSERIGRQLREEKDGLLRDLTARRGLRGEVFRFWETGPGYDKNIWSMHKAIEKAEYCHRNPVRRGLVKAPDLWRWSSFRWLEYGHQEDEPLSIDEWKE